MLRARGGFLALAALACCTGCGTDLRGVGGPNLDGNGISVSGLYPGFYPRSEPGTCTVAGATGSRTLVFVTKDTKSLVPQVLVSLPEYHGPGVYSAATGEAVVTARLGKELHWGSGAGTVTIEDESATAVHGSIAVDLHELASDGFGDRPAAAQGRWSCTVLTGASGQN